MFLLGILSIFQIILLPGLLLLKLFKVKTQNNIQTFLYSFGLSLSFNYFLICILVFLKIYLPVTIFILFFFEILLFTYLIFKKEIRINFDNSIKDYFFSFLGYLKNISRIHRILLLFSCLLLLFFISLIYSNADTVFYFTDAIARKPWIKIWSSNHFFSFGHYLQFLPVNLNR